MAAPLDIICALPGLASRARRGRNVQHHQVGLLRQGVYSRLAGYEETNDAERLALDPVNAYGGRPGGERQAGSQYQHPESI